MKINCSKLEEFLNKLTKFDTILGIFKFRLFFGVDDKWGREDMLSSSQHEKYFDEISDNENKSFENRYISPVSFQSEYFGK